MRRRVRCAFKLTHKIVYKRSILQLRLQFRAMALVGIAYGGVVLTAFYTLICMCSGCFVPRNDA